MEKANHKLLPLIFYLNTIEGFFVFAILALTPSDGKNSILAGFSLQRILTLLVVIAVIALFCILSWTIHKDFKTGRQLKEIYQDPQKSLFIFWGTVIIGTVLFNLLLIPDYLLGNSIFIFNRIRPVILWAGLICYQSSLPVLLAYINTNLDGIKETGKHYRPIIILAASILGGFSGIWAWMAWSGMGIFPDITFWNDPGVPLLILQVYIAVLLGTGFFLYEIGIKKHGGGFSKKVDWTLCLLIFLVAATLWNLTPQKSTVFAPGPYPPNDTFYPHSDAEVYDLSAQTALVGGGYNTPIGCPDKGLYVTFLTWLNYFAGLNQSLVIALQVIVFSILPVLIYLIGAQLNNRATGIIAAFLAIFKESNAISSASFISTTMSKMMMSEVPTAIFIAIFILFIILWIKNKGQEIYLVGILGGILGLSTMLRLTMYIFLPFTLVIMFVVLYKRWKKWIVSSVFFLLVLFASILPWVIRIQIVCEPDKPFYYVMGPLEGVIWQNRYNITTPAPALSMVLATPQQPTVELKPTQINSTAMVTPTEPGPMITATPIPSGFKSDQQRNINSPIKPSGQNIVNKGWALLGSAGDKLKFISSHFFHNLLTTTLIFPTTLDHDDIIHIANPVDSYWADNWDGRIGLLPGLLYFITLGLIALGIASAWKKWRLVGIIPFLVYLTFCLALGVARTSGGRYIVPIDWITYLYYAGGMVTLLTLGNDIVTKGISFHLEGQFSDAGAVEKSNKPQLKPSGLVLGIFLGIGLIIPGTEKVFPPQVYSAPSQQSVNHILGTGGFDKTEISQSKLYSATGRAINPRFFFVFQDLLPGGAVGVPMKYPRVVFTLIAKNIPAINVVLPTKLIPYELKNGSVVSVSGCLSEFGIDAVYVSIDNQNYYRDPPAENLNCPFKPIVCNNDNRICK